jgi:DNA-binding transcriptional MerR regulator
MQNKKRLNDSSDIDKLRGQQQLSAQELSISQILRAYGKQFTQIREQYTDGINGRCAMGVIMSYYGWDGKCCSNAERRLYAALVALRRAGISKESLIELNDSGMTFEEIADYLDRNKEMTNSKY